MAYKIFFPKVRESRPHVDIRYDDSALSNSAGDTKKNIMLIGSATQGDPSKVYRVSGLEEARRIFGSGDIVNACELAWNPANDGTQAGGVIYALRVENATQATFTKGAIKVVSDTFGSVANKTMVSFGKSSLSPNSYVFNVTAPNYQRQYVNIGSLFSIAYTGKGSNATYKVDVDPETKQAVKFTISYVPAGAGVASYAVEPTSTGKDDKASSTASAPSPAKSGSTATITFDLTKPNYSKIYQVMEAIANIPDFTVSSTSSSTSIDSLFLDETKSPVSISSTPVTVTATLGDLQYKMRNDPMVTVSIDLTQPITSFDTTALSGGTDGQVPTSWADKFNMIRGNNVYYIVPLTDKREIHAELNAFLQNEDDLGHQYRAFVGGGFSQPSDTQTVVNGGETIPDLINRQLSLKSPRIALVTPSLTYTSLDGVQRHVPAYMTAALTAGVASSLPVGNSILNKYVDIVSLDVNYSGDDLDTLFNNGIISLQPQADRSGFTGFNYSSDVTTYNSTNEPVLDTVSLGELTDFFLSGLRTYLERNYIGMNIELATPSVIQQGVASYLDTQKRAGLVADYKQSDINVIVDHDTANISFSVKPSLVMKYINVKVAYENLHETNISGINTVVD